jgi:DNA-binding GntR family transcriptional regulator
MTEDTALTALARHRRLSLKEEAAVYVRDLIFSGQLHPGERLDQDLIAAELGMSRLPVREALVSLETEGMVRTVPRRGAFVAELKEADILDHFHMYGLLSGIAAERVANAPPQGLTEQLAAISRQMRMTSDSAEHDRLNYDFHRLVNVSGASHRLKSVLRILSDNMPSHFFSINMEWEFREQTFVEHDAIVDAIARGSAEAASHAMAVHFVHVGEQAVHLLRGSGFWTDNQP